MGHSALHRVAIRWPIDHEATGMRLSVFTVWPPVPDRSHQERDRGHMSEPRYRARTPRRRAVRYTLAALLVLGMAIHGLLGSSGLSEAESRQQAAHSWASARGLLP